MFSKPFQEYSHLTLFKVFLGFTLICIICLSLYQWLNTTTDIALNATYESSLPLLEKGMHTEIPPTISDKLTLWIAELVERLTWHKAKDTLYVNVFLFFIVLSLATSIGLPRQIAALVAGMNLGVMVGVVTATLATTLGCLITFAVSRYLFSEKLTRKYPDKLAKLSVFLSEQTFLKALVIRILPLGSNFLTNIIAGVTKVSMPAYVSGSFVGFIPQMIIFSLAGSGLRLGAKNELVISVALFIVALLLSAYIIKKHRKKLN